MTYTKPQVLNVKAASTAIMGKKETDVTDNHINNSTASSYRSDE